MILKLVMRIPRQAALSAATKIAKWDIKINAIAILYQFLTKKPTSQLHQYIDWWQAHDSPIVYLFGYVGIEMINFVTQFDVMTSIIFLTSSWICKTLGPKVRINPILPKCD